MAPNPEASLTMMVATSLSATAAMPVFFPTSREKSRKTSLGGVLHNRNGGSARINANFENNSAGEKGGAIYIDSGTVEIGEASIFGSTVRSMATIRARAARFMSTAAPSVSRATARSQATVRTRAVRFMSIAAQSRSRTVSLGPSRSTGTVRTRAAQFMLTLARRSRSHRTISPLCATELTMVAGRSTATEAT